MVSDMFSREFSQLVRLFSKFRKNQLFQLILSGSQICLELVFIYQLQGLIDAIVYSNSSAVITSSFKGVILWGVASFLFNIIENSAWHKLRNRLINDLRWRLFDSSLRKPMSYLKSNSIGDLSSQILNDGTVIAQAAGMTILMIVLNLFQVVAILAIIWNVNVPICLILCVIIPIYAIVLILINGKVRDTFANERKSFAKLNEFLVGNLKGHQEIVMFNKEDYFSNKFSKMINVDYFSNLKKLINAEVLLFSLTNFMSIFIPITMMALAAFLSYQGYMSLGMVIVIYTYIQKLVEPIKNLSDSYQGIKKSLGAFDRLQDILQIKDMEYDADRLSVSTIHELTIYVDKLYNGEKVLIENLQLKLSSGQIVLIKGQSGAGKSTLLFAVLNSIRYKSDIKIQINNIDSNQLGHMSLKDSLLMAFQEAYIFAGTLRENILMGDTYSDEEINAVSRVACIDDFINNNGLDYELKEFGNNLSGGEKQRIALMRVLLRKPSVVLLDEPTSALDFDTKMSVVANIKEYAYKTKCIFIIVSHGEEFDYISDDIVII